jgi:putative sugar O-methyltransferase
VLEIGAGLGRTAYFAQQFGLRDYTIIDLPMTNVAQGYFLGRTLGQETVSLYLEDRPGVRILPPSAFLEATDRYDLVVNVDSLTEMAPDTARAYCRAIKARAGTFLSINHEHNRFTVGDLCAELGMVADSRTPYWLRRGYVDEVFSMAG